MKAARAVERFKLQQPLVSLAGLLVLRHGSPGLAVQAWPRLDGELLALEIWLRELMG